VNSVRYSQIIETDFKKEYIMLLLMSKSTHRPTFELAPSKIRMLDYTFLNTTNGQTLLLVR